MPSVARRASHLAVVRSPRWDQVDDAALVRGVLEGAAGAPGAVWDRHAARARAMLRRILGPSVDVDDLLQETFLQVFKELAKIREPEKFSSFIVGVAIRVARSELRRRRVRRWLSLTDEGAPPDVAGDEIDADAREAVKRLYALLDRYDDHRRTIFVLRYIEGLELTEVAEAMSVSLATAKRQLAKVTGWVRASAARDPLLADYVDRVTPVPGEARDG
jgi:RNA polymerase sigma-70 factor (ECF subfamily)